MDLPDSFLRKKKRYDEKLEDFLSRTEKDLVSGLDNQLITDRICKYLDIAPHGLFYENAKEKIMGQVEQLNRNQHKVLKTIDEKLDGFEKALKDQGIGWEFLSDKYTEEEYKRNRKELINIVVRSPIIGYGALVNYLPSKLANYFFEKSNNLYHLPTKWDLLGVFSYASVLTGEAILVDLATNFGGTFFISAIVTGIFYLAWSLGYDWKSFKRHLKRMKEYKQVQKNKKILGPLRKEKSMILGLIKDNFDLDKNNFFRNIDS